MAIWRLSRLQKRILRLLVAEHHRTQGGTSLSHYELVKALGLLFKGLYRNRINFKRL
jgi:hypothetical protein